MYRVQWKLFTASTTVLFIASIAYIASKFFHLFILSNSLCCQRHQSNLKGKLIKIWIKCRTLLKGMRITCEKFHFVKRKFTNFNLKTHKMKRAKILYKNLSYIQLYKKSIVFTFCMQTAEPSLILIAWFIF